MVVGQLHGRSVPWLCTERHPHPTPPPPAPPPTHHAVTATERKNTYRHRHAPFGLGAVLRSHHLPDHYRFHGCAPTTPPPDAHTANFTPAMLNDSTQFPTPFPPLPGRPTPQGSGFYTTPTHRLPALQEHSTGCASLMPKPVAGMIPDGSVHYRLPPPPARERTEHTTTTPTYNRSTVVV